MQTKIVNGDPSMAARAGRPPMAPKDRRKPIGARITPEIREQLEDAATENGRSLSQEIEFRLERSLKEEAAAGSRDLHRLQLLVGFAVTSIEVETGKGFAQDWPTFRRVMAAVETIIKAMRPEMSAELKAWFEDLGEDPGPYPALPEGPRGKARTPFDFPKPSAEDQEAYDKAVADHRDKSIDWLARLNARQERAQERRNFDRDLAEAGRAIAALLLPKRKGED